VSRGEVFFDMVGEVLYRGCGLVLVFELSLDTSQD
jgi:hypothetical protein